MVMVIIRPLCNKWLIADSYIVINVINRRCMMMYYDPEP